MSMRSESEKCPVNDTETRAAEHQEAARKLNRQCYKWMTNRNTPHPTK